MTRDEVKKIVMVISSSYPNWKPMDLKFTVDTWEMMLGEYEYNQIALALKAFIAGDTSGFAPSIGQLIERLHMISRQEEMSELEAWSLVYKAVCNSGYNAETEFNKLPEACKKAVGSHTNLKEWSMMDAETVQSVEQSHFVRNYRTIVSRMKDQDKMPKVIRDLIEYNQASGNLTIKKPVIDLAKTCDQDDIVVPMPEDIKKKFEEMLAE